MWRGRPVGPACGLLEIASGMPYVRSRWQRFDAPHPGMLVISISCGVSASGWSGPVPCRARPRGVSVKALVARHRCRATQPIFPSTRRVIQAVVTLLRRAPLYAWFYPVRGCVRGELVVRPDSLLAEPGSLDPLAAPSYSKRSILVQSRLPGRVGHQNPSFGDRAAAQRLNSRVNYLPWAIHPQVRRGNITPSGRQEQGLCRRF